MRRFMLLLFLLVGGLPVLVLSWVYWRLSRFHVLGLPCQTPHRRLVAFDFDGTLADSLDAAIQSYNDVAPKHRLSQLASEEVEQLRDLGLVTVLSRLGITRWRLPLLVWDIKRQMGRHIEQVPAFPGVREMFETLGRHHTLAIVTSNSASNVRRLLARHDIDPSWISFMVCDVGTFAKARALSFVTRSVGLPKDRILYVGDEVRDQEAASAVGIGFGAVAYGYTAPKVFEDIPVDFVASDVSRLAAAVEGWFRER